MSPLHLNIVSFTVPYPPNYGGVIDVFFKLKALSEQGVHIHLHCFRYDREPAPALEQYCDEVFYYHRTTGFLQQFSFTPYIVRSRYSEELIANLRKNPYPILMEGMHCTALLHHASLKDRILIYRESNIEHRYYYHLFLSERRLVPKLFHLIESARLLWYQDKLRSVSLMLTVSEEDKRYLAERFPSVPVRYLPSFHGNREIRIAEAPGKHVLFHGNLSVAENYKAAEFLITQVFPGLEIPLVIAGMKPPGWLIRMAAKHGVSLFADPSAKEMDQLIEDAQVNVLVTFQATGLKLKLINTLFRGRHVIVNSAMLSGTGLDGCCVIADDASLMKEAIRRLFPLPVPAEIYEARRSILSGRYSDEDQARSLVDFLQKPVSF